MEYADAVKAVAEDIKPLMLFLDLFLARHDMNDVDKMIEKMEDHDRSIGAWPFPETMRKAEVMEAQTDTFKAFRELLKIREKQITIQRKPDVNPGQEILRQMGLL